ncbi:MAG TPA: 2-oxoacid:acceptor oxidoreductase family protein [Thermoanaerobaculaceae bacterium]|nr:2-oxoacid:acceptor oxidoreductase family protein [Thermoanaerobaculaceae bacterium]
MHSEIVLAGFGGQGVLLIGKLMAYAGMKAGHEVTWMPSYGPEMRGGTCNCTVVLSDRPIGSPISKRPHALIVLNLPSLDKFEDAVRPGGIIVVNTSLINRLPKRTDVTVVTVPSNEIAIELGNAKAANMVALGAFLGASGLVDKASVTEVLKESFASRPKLVAINEQALERGFEIGVTQAAAVAAR